MRTLYTYLVCLVVMASCRTTKQTISSESSDTLSATVSTHSSRNWTRELVTEFFLPSSPVFWSPPVLGGAPEDPRVSTFSDSGSTEQGRPPTWLFNRAGGIPYEQAQGEQILVRQTLRESSIDTTSAVATVATASDTAIETIHTSTPPTVPWLAFLAGVVVGLVLMVIILLLIIIL